MTRLIDANALKESIDEHTYLVTHGFNETEYGCTQYGIHQIIDDAPTIDAEPVRHGKWIKADSQQYFRKHYPCFTCSECGYRKDSQKKWNYCPNCGCRMDGERKEEWTK